jgi:hypothetical protein
MNVKILLAVLLISCAAVFFGFQANILLQQTLQTEASVHSIFGATLGGKIMQPTGGDDVAGPGVPN